MMREAQAVAEKLGVTFRMPLEKRIEGAEKVGGSTRRRHCRMSKSGRAVEVDALIGSVIELAELTVGPPRLRHARCTRCLNNLWQRCWGEKHARVILQNV